MEHTTWNKGNDIESQIEARQAQSSESLRGVHEQMIRLVDNMVQTYLGNVRRTIQRVSNFVDNRRPSSNSNQPRDSPTADQREVTIMGQQVVDHLQGLSKRFRDFNLQWARVVGKQQSPLIDRIPPRGVELWRDFWDTVRKQVRRINQEFWQLSQDMTRMITGRLPSNPGTFVVGQPREAPLASLLYAGEAEAEQLARKFQEFYDKLSVTLGKEQAKMDGALSQMNAGSAQSNLLVDEPMDEQLLDEFDDEQTRKELTRNVALRQQIQQEINVFGSIFDIMRAFIARLRESASVFRDVLTPGAPNSNDAVTPGPSIKPTVDHLLEETINSQRNINGQSKPVMLPNDRPPSSSNLSVPSRQQG